MWCRSSWCWAGPSPILRLTGALRGWATGPAIRAGPSTRVTLCKYGFRRLRVAKWQVFCTDWTPWTGWSCHECCHGSRVGIALALGVAIESGDGLGRYSVAPSERVLAKFGPRRAPGPDAGRVRVRATCCRAFRS
jgi:hypothetical protein